MGWIRNATGKISDEPKFFAKDVEDACKILADYWSEPKPWKRNDEYDTFPAPFHCDTSDYKQRYTGYSGEASRVPRGDTAIVVIAANGNEFCRYVFRPDQHPKEKQCK